MLNWTTIRESLVPVRDKSTLPSSVKLPILPLAVTKFAERAEDPNSDPRELGKIIESDSGLTAELLRYVNSSAMGARAKLSTAQQAITRLGIRDSKLFILTTAVKRSMKSAESRLINIQNFWMNNLERALVAREVAKLLKTDGELAFAAGLLQDFLLPLLSNELYPVYLRFTQEQLTNPVELTQFERQAFKWDHADAAAQIMLQWKFPDDLICCVYAHHRGLNLLKDPQLGRSAAAAVAVSALVPDQLHQIPDGLEQLVKLDSVWPQFKLTELAERVDAQYREMSPGPVNQFSLLRHVKRMTAAC